MTSYNVQESSQSVTICVSLSGNTSIPITIEFSTTDLTATGKNDMIASFFNHSVHLQSY